MKANVLGLNWVCSGVVEECNNRIFPRGAGTICAGSYGCVECKGRFCARCVFKCNQCHEPKCLDCGELGDCEECGKSSCRDCTFTFECSSCDRTRCSDCGDFFICNQCGQTKCHDCNWCGMCEACDAINCQDCNFHAGQGEIEKCEQCGVQYCHGCHDWYECGNMLCGTRHCRDCGNVGGGRGFCSGRCEWKSRPENEFY